VSSPFDIHSGHSRLRVLLEMVPTLALIRYIPVEFMEPIKYNDQIVIFLLAQYVLLSALTSSSSGLPFRECRYIYNKRLEF
jgi:hypothetical protein